MTINSVEKHSKALNMAMILAVFTLIYNIIEGAVSTSIGYSDDNLTLFGFGVDSLIEAISGFGIIQMVIRIRKNPDTHRSHFEKRALRITGVGFYILVVGLLVTVANNVLNNNKPETTMWGIVIAVLSIITMSVLVKYKLKVGNELSSNAILADAKCTRACMYMSIILLCSSGLYELTNWGYFDSIGSLGIAYLSYKEGKECFHNAKYDTSCACNH